MKENRVLLVITIIAVFVVGGMIINDNLGLRGRITKLEAQIATKADNEEFQTAFKNVRTEIKERHGELQVKFQNETLERDRVDQEFGRQIGNLVQSVDNLASGVRDLVRERMKFTDATAALTEAEAKVAAVENAVRELVVKLEESRQAAAGVGAGNVTVFSPEDKVLSAFEVANIVDRFDKALRALTEQLAEARLLEQEIRNHQQAEETEEGD